MADMLSAGASWLTGQLKSAAGMTVTYTRGAESAEIVATIGRSQFEAANQSGVLEQWESRDYLITAADLPYGDPERGDLITENHGGDLVVYEVASPRGVPEWHYGDAFRSIVRVHTTVTESGAVFLMTENGEQLTTETGDLLAV
jgi:hypothetical protein